MLNLGFLLPLLRICTGEPVKPQLKELGRSLGVPLLAIALFLGAWGALAPRVHTSLGVLPGPVEVWHQAENLWADHMAERARQRAFYARQEKRNAELLGEDPKCRGEDQALYRRADVS